METVKEELFTEHFYTLKEASGIFKACAITINKWLKRSELGIEFKERSKHDFIRDGKVIVRKKVYITKKGMNQIYQCIMDEKI